MRKQMKKKLAVSLTLTGLVISMLCIIFPFFTFWNYRLTMIPAFLVCLFSFLSVLKERKSLVDVVCGCVVFLLVFALVYFGGSMTSTIICATICVLIAIGLVGQRKIAKITKKRAVSFSLGVIL